MQIKLYNAFALGMLTILGVSMAIQDYLGLEKYVEILKAHWVELNPLFGAIVVFWALLLFARLVNTE